MFAEAAHPRQSLASAVGWSLSWALGVGLGVALGGWLTLVGGAGAPGAAGLDPLSDLVVLPGAAFLAMFVVQLAVRLVVRARRRPAGGNRDEENRDERSRDHGVRG